MYSVIWGSGLRLSDYFMLVIAYLFI
uniref:Uncharacterized protein n=1 Tax=Rhizophora mucronata TaxID=61149 RepID=A0A2P2Q6J4_RHIMU